MNYLVQPYADGMAVITWCLDEHYNDNYAQEDETIYWHLFVNIYDAKGTLLDETGIGGISNDFREKSAEFNQEMIKMFLYHFSEDAIQSTFEQKDKKND